jgi:photosystem II PsbJ protein
MSSKKSLYPDGRIPDRLPDGRPAVAWRSRWTEGVLPLWLVATAGGMAVFFRCGLVLLRGLYRSRFRLNHTLQFIRQAGYKASFFYGFHNVQTL